MMISERIGKVRQKMKERGLDGLIVSSPVNCFYLTDFGKPSGDFRAVEIFLTQSEFFVVTNPLYFGAVEVWKQKSEKTIREKIKIENAISEPPPEIFNQICSDLKLKKIGFEADDLKFSEYLKLKKALSGIALIAADTIFETLRKIKDVEEIKRIKKAAAIADLTFKHILSFIRPGLTEKEVADEIDYFMKKNGADGNAFETIVASGPNSAIPHHKTGQRKLGKREIILLDFGANYQGYCSDMTRTVFLGPPTTKQKGVYGKVLEAGKTALAKMKKGMTVKEVDHLARGYLRQHRLSKFFSHNLGHSFGLEIHEKPSLGPYGEERIESGMIFTVEPGIYFPDKFGIRLEDDVLVKENDVELLTHSPKELTRL